MVEREGQNDVRGFKCGDMRVGVSQMMVSEGWPSYETVLQKVRGLQKEYPGMAAEIMLRRGQQTPESEDWNLILGVHGPFQGDWKQVAEIVFGGVKMGLVDRVYGLGMGFFMGVEKGVMAWGCNGYKSAREMRAYYNIHPDVARSLGEGMKGYDHNTVRIENGWYYADVPLSHDVISLKDFKDRWGVRVTMDIAHALQAAEAAGKDKQTYVRQMWELLLPAVVHFSDRGESEDHYPIGYGKNLGLLKELLVEMKKREDLIVILEVKTRLHPSSSVGLVVEDAIGFLMTGSVDTKPPVVFGSLVR